MSGPNDDYDEESTDSDDWDRGWNASEDDGPYDDNGMPNPAYDGREEDDE